MQTEANSAHRTTLGVIGASSLVGGCLLPLLVRAGGRATAYSRKLHQSRADGVEWVRLPVPGDSAGLTQLLQSSSGIAHWICLAPIWVLAEHFELLEAHGAKRIVALSSSSRFTKQDSSVADEQALARRLADGEERLQTWAAGRGVESVILRPTLIYGLGQDKNISEMARFIQRFGFFPLLGKAMGARQPVHAQDVAMACFAALNCAVAANRAYSISGGETLPYREMVGRVFTVLQRRPRLITVPLPAFRCTVALLHCLPRYRHWSAGMAERMNRDLVFDHADASRDFGFTPRPFRLTPADLPRCAAASR